MSPSTNFDIGRAIAYTEQRCRQDQLDRRLADLPAAAMAACITSGPCGVTLSKLLHAHFPNARRAEVYLAISLAVAHLQAELTIGRMELDRLRKSGAES